ncbi:MarR family winged helix-turn-helix transcriptional regulator [Ferirhizobium litorale]|uniref:MarR family winged helix-turn-helix transcriptional regulator n=1 Tax=Ferirhizobium litorale TaxID=2927786 RepID=A0AAE3QDL7_9HYPH|nr:MarR family winged helix-turn-helix transcriptional regulator [Fererhizobium litorale]MDI7921333.1 MarR family winged helix-turn-helix transcriptional regulator [Fererhizobium litorale]
MRDEIGFELETFLPYRLNRAAEFVGLRFATQYKEKFGLTRPEWRALAALGSVGRMRATEIGAHSAMHKTKVSRAVYSLEQRRWLKRTGDERDRRSEKLELTAAGKRAYAELSALASAYQAELVSLLGARDMKALTNGLGAVEKLLAGPSRHNASPRADENLPAEKS